MQPLIQSESVLEGHGLIKLPPKASTNLQSKELHKPIYKVKAGSVACQSV